MGLIKSAGKFRRKHTTAFWILILISIGLIMFAGIWALTAFGVGPTEKTTLTVYDIADDNKDITSDTKATVYRTKKQLDDYKESKKLDFNDYEVVIEKTTADKIEFTKSDDYSYWIKLEYKGSEEWFRPPEGEVIKLMLKHTDNIDTLTYDENMNTDITSTTERDWTIKVKPDSEEGLLPFYDFKNDRNEYFILNFTFDVAGDASYLKLKNGVAEEEISGNSVLLKSHRIIYNAAEFDIQFDDSIGTDFNIQSVTTGFGNPDASIEYL